MLSSSYPPLLSRDFGSLLGLANRLTSTNPPDTQALVEYFAQAGTSPCAESARRFLGVLAELGSVDQGNLNLPKTGAKFRIPTTGFNSFELTRDEIINPLRNLVDSAEKIQFLQTNWVEDTLKLICDKIRPQLEGIVKSVSRSLEMVKQVLNQQSKPNS